jgi:uncharacterized lipoprotein YmbA
MSVVIRRCLLFLVVAGGLAACASAPERQWYKPNENYTVAEFRQDRDGCTTRDVLDEDCLRRRGWVPLTRDKEYISAPPAAAGRSRY